MAADDELSKKLAKRNLINEGEAAPQLNKKIPISAEFKEFSIKEIQFYTATFKKWDANGNGYVWGCKLCVAFTVNPGGSGWTGGIGKPGVNRERHFVGVSLISFVIHSIKCSANKV